MSVLIGSENTRRIVFGKKHAVTVTFTRINGMWHAHAALLPRPRRNIREARRAVRDRLVRLSKEVSDE